MRKLFNNLTSALPLRPPIHVLYDFRRAEHHIIMSAKKKSTKSAESAPTNFSLTWAKRIGVLSVLVVLFGWLDTIKVRSSVFLV